MLSNLVIIFTSSAVTYRTAPRSFPPRSRYGFRYDPPSRRNQGHPSPRNRSGRSAWPRRGRSGDGARGERRDLPHLRTSEGDVRRNARDHVVGDRQHTDRPHVKPRRGQHRRRHPRRLFAAQGRRRGAAHRPCARGAGGRGAGGSGGRCVRQAHRRQGPHRHHPFAAGGVAGSGHHR